MSVCSILRSPFLAYSIDSNLSNISLDEAKVIRVIAFSLLDYPEPKVDDVSEYSTNREYPFNIPVIE